MPRGINVTLASATNTNVVGTKGGNTPSIKVLNPNDGILYVAADGKPNPTSWDWVIPSQSFAQLPGPFISYGFYYLDRSGAGLAGNFTIYESLEEIDTPVYSAIGRAVAAQSTNLDINQGTVPANPPAGISRLWANIADGSIHDLLSTGVDGTLIASPIGYNIASAVSDSVPIAVSPAVGAWANVGNGINFTVHKAGAILLVTCNHQGFWSATSGVQADLLVAVNIDEISPGAGTLRYINSVRSITGSINPRIAGCSTYFVSGLAAGVHTARLNAFNSGPGNGTLSIAAGGIDQLLWDIIELDWF